MAAPRAETPPATRSPVVVELFSSEGCSSCPSAEDVLRDLEGDPTIVPLELHVDYWNGLGWADPFSKAAFTERQRVYSARMKKDGIYTPQAIVNGAHDLVGSDRRGLLAAVARARENARDTSAVTLVREGDALVVTVVRAPAEGAEVRLFTAESGLVSKVTRGENAGQRLVHAPVVRAIDELGSAKVGSTIRIARPRAPHTRYAVTVADTRTGEIVAASTTE